MDLQGKAVLVTGAAVRVGRTIALECARRGASIAVHYNRSERPAHATVAELEALGVRAVAVQAALEDHGQVTRMVDEAAERLGRLDAVVNNASVFYQTPVSDVADEQWQEVLAVNLLAPWWVVQAAVPHFRAAGRGHVVNIADWAGLKPYTGYLPYVVSKGALVTMTKALAKELAPDIQVNAVLPGPMLPPPDMSPEESDRVARRIPLKRWGKPEDVAAAVVYFLTSDYSTGSLLSVDGGSLIT